MFQYTASQYSVMMLMKIGCSCD